MDVLYWPPSFLPPSQLAKAVSLSDIAFPGLPTPVRVAFFAAFVIEAIPYISTATNTRMSTLHQRHSFQPSKKKEHISTHDMSMIPQRRDSYTSAHPHAHAGAGPSPISEHGSPPEEHIHRRRPFVPGSPWKKRVSTACLSCKKSKRKCSGTAPCDNCRAFHRVCIFDESLDQRRRVAAKRTADELTYHRDLLNDLFKLVREADESKALQLLDRIRGNAPPSEIRAYINDTLSSLSAAATAAAATHHRAASETVAKVEDMRNLINVEDPAPAFRSKVMDIHYLCDEAPIKVPARPWTNVTDDAGLVSHLVSLYFTWDHPFHAFLDERVFLRHMAKGDLGSQFCSPFLVNAMLSNACVCSLFAPLVLTSCGRG